MSSRPQDGFSPVSRLGALHMIECFWCSTEYDGTYYRWMCPDCSCSCCDAHGDTIRYRCSHYQQDRKDGYAAALRDAVEALEANFEFDELGDQRLAVEIVEALKGER